MLETVAKDLREAQSARDYWMEYAFRLEEENGAALHRPLPDRDKNVTKTF
jgi:hypothetical protein